MRQASRPPTPSMTAPKPGWSLANPFLRKPAATNSWKSESGKVKIDSVDSALPKRSEEHTSELQSRLHLVCRLLLEKKNNISVARSHNLHHRSDCPSRTFSRPALRYVSSALR